MSFTVESAISSFGAAATAKLSNVAVGGNPEDQLRAPFEQLLIDMALLAAYSNVTAVGESTLSHLGLRPDYAVTIANALTGFVELKAPGKGADPRSFTNPHDKEQGKKLLSLPNVLFTDGNAFSLWQNGELVGKLLTLDGDVRSSGAKLAPPPGLQALFEAFLTWKPSPPSSAKELAHTTARLCRFLRDEAIEQLSRKSPALTSLAQDWRKLLFPEATNERFADGYAQAVTFGLLMARAKGITLDDSLQHAADELSHSSTLIGAALHLLTEDPDNRKSLKTSLSVLIRVLNAVDWNKIAKGDSDAWLYFYEEFLATYDNKLRKLTGSYYTPPEVVEGMVALIDEALRSPRFNLHTGFASPAVTIADPATGTGTFPLGILRRVAKNVSADQGEGAVPDAIDAALRRIIAFEMQLGPFAVAQLRILAEVLDLTGSASTQSLRMFVTNTLGNPYDDEGQITGLIPRVIAQSRKDANRIKREETITVVIGNPPYKEKAMGKGAWIEGQSKADEKKAPLNEWQPPKAWGIGAHAKHLRNLYIYFWRWATWKVFDPDPLATPDAQSKPKTGIVCFITVSGFLNGPGFEKMRDYLRRACDDLWVIDCSPEGHQPTVNTRIFQGVQQPVCIVMASRSSANDKDVPAIVHFQALPLGHRTLKFKSLLELKLGGDGWIAGPNGWRDSFLPRSVGAWSTYPLLEDLFLYNGSGVQAKRTWVIAPDPITLHRRWSALLSANQVDQEDLFQATMRDGEPADRHMGSILKEGIPGYPPPARTLAAETGPAMDPIPYSFRTFNRQWIIPDIRLITQPNATLWSSDSSQQIYLTALSRTSPSNGPALGFAAGVPDLDYYKGSFGGRVFPMWSNAAGTQTNFRPALVAYLSESFGISVTPEDLFSYIAAIAANPAYTSRFQPDLSTPGLRIPLTADAVLFGEAAKVGRRVLWLHTFGERMTDPSVDRPFGPPRVIVNPPTIPLAGRISGKPEDFPDTLGYDAENCRLLVGHGFIDNVSPAVWAYEVSGKHVLLQWFSYRRLNRERPVIGDRRPPSALNNIQPDHWLPEYTAELLNVINVLTLLVELEPTQADLLDRICAGPLISNDTLTTAGALMTPPKTEKLKKSKNKGPGLF